MALISSALLPRTYKTASASRGPFSFGAGIFMALRIR
jgi:hypothetical protein